MPSQSSNLLLFFCVEQNSDHDSREGIFFSGLLLSCFSDGAIDAADDAFFKRK